MQQIPFVQFQGQDIPTVKNGPGQPILRCKPDVHAYAVYMASVSRKSVSEIIDEALRFAFSNVRFQSVQVYDVVYGDEEGGSE